MNKEKRIGIIMHGVTGRMGMNQHLIRSILEIRKQGGVALKDGTRLMPDPLLVGRNAQKIEALARQHGVQRWTADLDAALKSKDDRVFFDAASTQLRPALLKRAIRAGKHVYCEKPVATTLAVSLGQAPLALAAPAALAASCAFMLPAATPPNAVVFGSGRLRIVDMARAGILFNLVSIAVIAAAGALGMPGWLVVSG